jgi:uncharacterized protein
MDAALIASAALLGLAGTPHCAAMCGAPCAAVVGRSGPGATLAFQGARLASYAAGGAIAATSVGAMAGLAQWSPLLRPLWTLLHAGALALGLWLLWQGRQPQWMAALGRSPQLAGGWQRLHGPTRAAVAGSLWVGWPCGLLQSALLVAALTQGAAAGATAMAAFALTSSAGLWLAPWIWQRIGMAGTAAGARAERWAVRAAGAMLVLASGWTLGHGLWQRVAAYCFPGG